MQRTYGRNPIPRWAGAAFLTVGAVFVVVAFIHDFRNNRGVRPGETGRGIAITTGVIGGLLGALGLCLVFVDTGVTIDTSRKTVHPPLRPLSDFDRVRVKTTTLGPLTTRHDVELAGRGEPVPLDQSFDRDRALASAREIARFVGLPVEGDAPPVPSAVQLNKALEVFQAFGPERRVEVEERWKEKLPDVPAASHSHLRARCEEIEAVAAELAGRVLDREITQDAGLAELGRRFPELDPGRLSHTFGQAIYFESK